MRPIHRVRHETVLDWVEMRVVHVNREVAIIAERMLSAMRATSKFDRRSSRFTVSKNVPPGTRLPDLGERRNALGAGQEFYRAGRMSCVLRGLASRGTSG
jgi:hypothetical protein